MTRLEREGFLVAVALLVCVAEAAVAQPVPANAPNPQAVEEVLAGERTEANAAWWGFDPEDSTEYIQAAIDSGVRKVVVPYVGADWIVRPLRLRGNIEILFEPGVLVLAKKGEFKGKGDSLFTASNASDIVLRGYGATLRMRKEDYRSDAYEKAEWRMALDFMGCRGIRIEGLRLESSGGDGIYLGATEKRPYCADVVIRDVVCHDNHRQGISVIGAENLLIENCILSNTGGTSPQAGIDLEPNQANEKLVNCVIRNCVMADNCGAGILIYLKNLSQETAPVSILFENCYVRGGRDVGIGIGAVKDNGPEGLIEFKNCTIEGAERGGIYVYDKSADSARVRFVNCKWRNVGSRFAAGKTPRPPLLIDLRRPALTEKLGGVDFADCYVYDDADRPALTADPRDDELAVHDLQGALFVVNPHGACIEVGGAQADLGLVVSEMPGAGGS